VNDVKEIKEKNFDDLLEAIKSQQTKENTNILVERHYYLIRLDLHDKLDRLITPTDNLVFKDTGLDLTKVEILKRNSIGSLIIIQANPLPKDQTELKMQSFFKLDRIQPQGNE